MIQVQFVHFDPKTGEIRGHGTMDRASINHMDETLGGYMAGIADPESQFVDLPMREFRDKSPCLAQLDGLKLTNLPQPCRIYIENVIYLCEDDHAELEFEQPGDYVVIVKSARFYPGIYVVSA